MNLIFVGTCFQTIPNDTPRFKKSAHFFLLHQLFGREISSSSSYHQPHKKNRRATSIEARVFLFLVLLVIVRRLVLAVCIA